MSYQIKQEVLTAIHDERVYQNRKWGTIETHPHEVGAWLTIMRSILSEADRAWASSASNAAALDKVRCLASVGIACMEQHGVVVRDAYEYTIIKSVR